MKRLARSLALFGVLAGALGYWALTGSRVTAIGAPEILEVARSEVGRAAETEAPADSQFLSPAGAPGSVSRSSALVHPAGTTAPPGAGVDRVALSLRQRRLLEELRKNAGAPTRLTLQLSEPVGYASYVLTDAETGSLIGYGPVRDVDLEGQIDLVGPKRVDLFVGTDRGCALVLDLHVPGGEQLYVPLSLTAGATLVVTSEGVSTREQYAVRLGRTFVAIGRLGDRPSAEHRVPVGLLEIGSLGASPYHTVDLAPGEIWRLESGKPEPIASIDSQEPRPVLRKMENGNYEVVR